MYDDHSQSPALVEVKLAADVTPFRPAKIEPEMLIQGFRALQARIPGFVQLSIRERRSKSRAANLDPEVIETGLHAATAWHDTAGLLHRTPEELRWDDDDIRRNEELIREVRVLLQGLEDANLTLKHRLGHDLLRIYRVLAIHLRAEDPTSEHAYMRPYYENMKRAYLQSTRRKPRKGDAAEGKEEEAENAKATA